MGQKQAGRYCYQCHKDVLAVGNRPNHLLHLVLAMLTLGLWTPVWIVLTIWYWDSYRCTECGRPV